MDLEDCNLLIVVEKGRLAQMWTPYAALLHNLRPDLDCSC